MHDREHSRTFRRRQSLSRSACRRPARLIALAVGALLVAGPMPAAARRIEVRAGSLQAVIDPDPFTIDFVSPRGTRLLSTDSGGNQGSPGGALAYRRAGRWWHARRLRAGRRDGAAYVATLTTDDRALRSISLRIAPGPDGIITVSARGPAGTVQMTTGFLGMAGERFTGFGERSDAVVRDRGTVEDYVAEGPYQPSENTLISHLVPAPGFDPRPDATYFPIPWLLSSRGYGFLLRGNARSVFTLGSRWRVTAEDTRIEYRVYGGPTPARALRRFTADVGRQPPAAAPFYFGPWWQPSGTASANLDQLRRAGGGALGSLAETYTHYLPCGSQQGHTAAEQQTTRAFHQAGLAVTTYFNPMICTGYHPRFDQAAQARLLTRNPAGKPYLYRYTGVGQFSVGQFDFSAPGAGAFFGALLREAVAYGYDGWMEDFGEYTPLDSVSANRLPGPQMHNLYPVLYHGAADAFSRTVPRPLARFNRSGWTGAARVSQLVWGGDPSTTFGFDGLRSAVANGLTIGTSGVSLWGSDIGGYFALSLPQTTPDLERRWIEFGFASGVMRTEANGLSLKKQARAQIFDPGVLPVWTRYARLRTQFEPYLASAERGYDATGMPLMRQLMLSYPTDRRAITREDEYLFGPDLLVAPVLSADASTRSLYLPSGRWIDFWRSVRLGADGTPRLVRPVVLTGGRSVTVPAPADQLPMFVPAGASLGLLPADVQTLADYGRGVVHMRDRDGRRVLLAWPQTGPPTSASLAADATVRSGLDRALGWGLTVRQHRVRELDLQVALPGRPCQLLVNGRARAFHYAGGVLAAPVRIADGTVRTHGRC